MELDFFAVPSSAVRQPPNPKVEIADLRPKTTIRIEEEKEKKSERCKTKRLKTSIESLPDEMLFNILVRLPAQDIYDLIRLVCWKWYNLIHTRSFIHEHLQRSSAEHGLLIQFARRVNPVYLSMREEGGRPNNIILEISKFSYKFRDVVCSSCNGLIVVRDKANKNTHLLIANPATKQHFGLPPFFREVSLKLRSSIGYVAASSEYKVVVTYHEDGCNPSFSTNLECAILTVGVDRSWRHVRTDHLSPPDARRRLYSSTWLTKGFLHWAASDSPYVVILNLETETLTQTLIPGGHPENRFNKFFTDGSYFSYVVCCNKYVWELWELKSETGEWKKLPNIDLEAHADSVIARLYGDDHDCFKLYPVGWLKYKEVIVFDVTTHYSNVCIAYDIRTRTIHPFKLDLRCEAIFRPGHHVNSLVWLDHPC